jgi:hypothetical protein
MKYVKRLEQEILLIHEVMMMKYVKSMYTSCVLYALKVTFNDSK